MGKARALADEDNPDDARDLLRKALPTATAANRPWFQLELGRLERTLDEKPAAAVEAYEQAVAGFRESRDYAQEIAARLSLARYLAAKAANRVADAVKKARANLDEAQTMARRLSYPDAEWRVAYLNGVLLETGNHAVEALARYRDAVARLDRLRAGLSQPEQRQALVDNEWIEDLHARLTALLTRAGLHDEAWRYLERAKARSFVEALHGRATRADAAVPAVAELNAMEKRIFNLRTSLDPQNAALLRGAGRDPGPMKAELHELETRFALAREEAALSATRAGQQLALDPPPLAAIRKTLPPRTVLVEYGLLAGEVTVFVVTASKSTQLIWKADTGALRQDVQRLRSAFADPGSKGWKPLLERVSKTLWAPIAAAIPADTAQLVVAPASYLNYLPFGTLLTPDGKALVEVYSIACVPSASAMAYLKARKQKDATVFLGALGNSAVDGMPPLPGTLAETDGIAKVYPQARRESGGEFTHDTARRALLDFDVVHFATHGLVDVQAPLFSAVLTSPAPGQPSRLSLYEILDLHMRASMVVLSACETGLGKLRGGDEVTGLTRTLLTAGADTVVSSLWQVSDESTALLMQGFYRNLHEGLAPADALRESALAVRARYPHPFYWAPFVVTGRS